jgi:hypothetical protein
MRSAPASELGLGQTAWRAEGMPWKP